MKIVTDPKAAVRARSWATAQTFDGDFGAAELATAAKCSLEDASFEIQCWLIDGLVTETQRRAGPIRQRVRVTATSAAAQVAQIGRTSADNMWHAARRLRRFSPTDISAHATTEAIKVDVAEAAAYCRALLAAGYLRVSRKASPKNAREATYCLARDTGPRPPREKRVRAVIDENTGTAYLLGGKHQ